MAIQGNILSMITGDIRYHEHFGLRKPRELRVGDEIKGVFMVFLMSHKCADVVKHRGGEEKAAVG